MSKEKCNHVCILERTLCVLCEEAWSLVARLGDGKGVQVRDDGSQDQGNRLEEVDRSQFPS